MSRSSKLTIQLFSSQNILTLFWICSQEVFSPSYFLTLSPAGLFCEWHCLVPTSRVDVYVDGTPGLILLTHLMRALLTSWVNPCIIGWYLVIKGGIQLLFIRDLSIIITCPKWDSSLWTKARSLLEIAIIRLRLLSHHGRFFHTRFIIWQKIKKLLDFN